MEHQRHTPDSSMDSLLWELSGELAAVFILENGAVDCKNQCGGSGYYFERKAGEQGWPKCYREQIHIRHGRLWSCNSNGGETSNRSKALCIPQKIPPWNSHVQPPTSNYVLTAGMSTIDDDGLELKNKSTPCIQSKSPEIPCRTLHLTKGKLDSGT